MSDLVRALTTRYGSSADVMDALSTGSPAEDPVAHFKSLADATPFEESKLRLLTGIWQHHVVPLRNENNCNKRKLETIVRELEAERAPKRARLESPSSASVAPTSIVAPSESKVEHRPLVVSEIKVPEVKREKEGKEVKKENLTPIEDGLDDADMAYLENHLGEFLDHENAGMDNKHVEMNHKHVDHKRMDRKHAEKESDSESESESEFLDEIKDDGSMDDIEDLPKGSTRFRNCFVHGKVFQVGDFFFVDDAGFDEEVEHCLRNEIEPPVRPMAKIEAFFIDQDGDREMILAWCYTGADLRKYAPKISQTTLDNYDIRHGDHVLSNHVQRYPITGIHVDSCELIAGGNGPVHDTLLYDATRKTLVQTSDWASDRKVQDRSAASTVFTERNAFFDCLLMEPSLVTKSTFWRRVQDTFLRNLGDHGKPDNKQRQILEDTKYEYEYKALDKNVMRMCFCCGMKKSCSWKIVTPKLNRGPRPILIKYVGRSCQARLVKIRDFMRYMAEKSKVTRDQEGVVAPSLIDAWFNRVKLLMV